MDRSRTPTRQRARLPSDESVKSRNWFAGAVRIQLRESRKRSRREELLLEPLIASGPPLADTGTKSTTGGDDLRGGVEYNPDDFAFELKKEDVFSDTLYQDKLEECTLDRIGDLVDEYAFRRGGFQDGVAVVATTPERIRSAQIIATLQSVCGLPQLASLEEDKLDFKQTYPRPSPDKTPNLTPNQTPDQTSNQTPNQTLDQTRPKQQAKADNDCELKALTESDTITAGPITPETDTVDSCAGANYALEVFEACRPFQFHSGIPIEVQQCNMLLIERLLRQRGVWPSFDDEDLYRLLKEISDVAADPDLFEDLVEEYGDEPIAVAKLFEDFDKHLESIIKDVTRHCKGCGHPHDDCHC